MLAVLAAFAVLQNFQPRYLASHVLESNGDYVVFQDLFSNASDLERTERSLVFSPLVLDPVLADPTLRQARSLSDPSSAEANLRENLSLTNGGVASRLVVSFEDTEREFAALVCNAVVESYLRQRDAFDKMRVNNLERWLSPEITRWEKEVEKRQQAVLHLGSTIVGEGFTHSVGQIEHNLMYSRLNELKSQINDVELRVEVLDAQLDSNTDGEATGPEPQQGKSRSKQRKRKDLAIKLDVLKRAYGKVRENQGRSVIDFANLEFAEQELMVANGVLAKLRDRVAAIRTERRADGAVRSLVPAVPPRTPVEAFPIKRLTVCSTTAFLVPFLVGFVLGFRSPGEDHEEVE